MDCQFTEICFYSRNCRIKQQSENCSASRDFKKSGNIQRSKTGKRAIKSDSIVSMEIVHSRPGQKPVSMV